MIGDTGQDVGEPRLGIDVVEATSRDYRQHDCGTIGTTLAAGEGLVAPSQGDASQCAFSAIVGQADPAVVEEAGEAVPGPEHVIHRFIGFRTSEERERVSRSRSSQVRVSVNPGQRFR